MRKVTGFVPLNEAISDMSVDLACLLAQRLGGGPSITGRKSAAAYVSAMWADPARLQRLVAALSDAARHMLCLLNFFGGALDKDEICTIFIAAGLRCESYQWADEDASEAFAELVNLGIVLPKNFYASKKIGVRTNLVETERTAELYFLDRYVAAILPLPSLPQQALAARPDPTSGMRLMRPQRVRLESMRFLDAVDVSGVAEYVSQPGEYIPAGLKKLARILGMPSEGSDPGSGVVFDWMPVRYLVMFRSIGLLTEQPNRQLRTTESVKLFHKQSFALSVRTMLMYFLQDRYYRDHPFTEYMLKSWDSPARYLPQFRLRQMFVAFLLTLVNHGARFIHIADVMQVWYERVAPLIPPMIVRQVDKLSKQKTAELREFTELWVKHCLGTWLYTLGIVEVSHVDGKIDAFRITPHGRAVLAGYADREDSLPAAPVASKPWVVQPNFDVLLMFEDASSEQLAALYAVAELRVLSDHTATFHLSKPSVLSALKNGASYESILQMLSAGSRTALPQNVVIQLRSWAAVFEQIVLTDSAQLLEFDSQEQRDAAMGDAALQAIVAESIGERFILLKPGAQASSSLGVRTFERHGVEGLKGLVSAVSDDRFAVSGSLVRWYVEPTMRQWAELQADGTWLFTSNSVRDAASRGLKVDDLLDFLLKKSGVHLSESYQAALRFWGRKRNRQSPQPIDFTPTYLVNLPDRDAFFALGHDPRLKSALLAMKESTNSIVFLADKLGEVQDVLRLAGLLPKDESS